jgi:hypothetical protein
MPRNVLLREFVEIQVREPVFIVIVVELRGTQRPRAVCNSEDPTMAMQDSQTVATDETSTLISSDKVEGTAVYNRSGDKLGSVHTLMIDKISGNVTYAVMSFGGFLGIGDRYHPLPWEVLTYDTRQGGYVVDLDRSRLEEAPSYGANEDPNWSDLSWGQRVHDYYGARPYWQ